MQLAHYRLWLILGLALAVAALYWPSTVVFDTQWSDLANLTYTHGWLILIVCVALTFASRRRISAAAAAPWPLALAGLALCIFSWLVCELASIQDLHITIFPAIFWLAAAAAFGWGVARWLIFPVAFFYFAVPSWSQLSEPLQSLTVIAMRGLLALTGPPALISGALIHVPNGSFIVQEGCSGLHFVIVGLAVAALHGELRRDAWRTRLMQLALMGALALLANWVRVYVIIEVGYLTDMHSWLLKNHYWFGWGVFAVALAAFFFLAARFEPPAEADAAEEPSAAVPTADAAWTSQLKGFALALMVLAALPAGSAALRKLSPPAVPGRAFPDTPPAWTPAPVDIRSAWRPIFNGASRQQRLAFADPAGDALEMLRVFYQSQHQGAELVGSGSSVIGSGLQPRGQRTIATPVGEFRETEVIDRLGARSLIWSRYEIAGRSFVVPLASQLWYGINATVSNPPAGLIALRTECAADCVHARDVLHSFLAAGTPRQSARLGDLP
jgi:EpsI family protein